MKAWTNIKNILVMVAATVAVVSFVAFLTTCEKGSAIAIKVQTATYGWNCRQAKVPVPHKNLVTKGNATKFAKAACDGRSVCRLQVDVKKLGDPANACGKDFIVIWRCGDDSTLHRAHVPGEANGKTVVLKCPARPAKTK